MWGHFTPTLEHVRNPAAHARQLAARPQDACDAAPGWSDSLTVGGVARCTWHAAREVASSGSVAEEEPLWSGSAREPVISGSRWPMASSGPVCDAVE